MERVFTIKTKSQPDQFNQYPSERRYSASCVLGLSAGLLILSMLSLLMGSLLVHKMSLPAQHNGSALAQKVVSELEYTTPGYLHYFINIPVLICSGCFLMALGNLIASVTGLFAWKRWYIDHNITFFFLSCSVSTFTSALSFAIVVVSCTNLEFAHFDEQDQVLPPLTLSLTVNVIVLSLANVIWSLIATKLAYRGMTNFYPDDTLERGRSRALVSSGGRCMPNNIPIEVINSFTIGKMVGILPKKENSDLPNRETSVEYQQRVDKFLNAEPEIEFTPDTKETKGDS